MRNSITRLSALAFGIFAFTSPSVADDWVAIKLRGAVFAQVNGQWQQLQRGDVVSDERRIRTGSNSRVTFQRDKETIELAADTEAQIFDKDGAKFTTVKQHFGMIPVEAERRNVQHFAVETPFLAAVVKGTKFIVRSNQAQAMVNVVRGTVQVDDSVNDLTVEVTRSQSAGVALGQPLNVAGLGELPQVLNKDGTPYVDPEVAKAIADAQKAAAEQALLARDAVHAAQIAAAKAAKDGTREAREAAREAAKAAREAVKDAREAAKDARETKEDPESQSDKGNGSGKGGDDKSGKGGDDKPGKGGDDNPKGGDDKPGKGDDDQPGKGGDDNSGEGGGDNSGKGGSDSGDDKPSTGDDDGGSSDKGDKGGNSDKGGSGKGGKDD